MANCITEVDGFGGHPCPAVDEVCSVRSKNDWWVEWKLVEGCTFSFVADSEFLVFPELILPALSLCLPLLFRSPVDQSTGKAQFTKVQNREQITETQLFRTTTYIVVHRRKIRVRVRV